MNGKPGFRGPAGTIGPGNRRDVHRMELLTWEQQVRVMKRAAELYDGSRTVARCWTEALDDAAERERDARAAAFFLSVTDGVAGFGHITEGKNRTA